MDCLEEMMCSDEEIKLELCADAMNTYGFMCFLCDSYECTLRALDFMEMKLERHFKTSDEFSPKCIEALLTSWTLLTSRMDPYDILERAQNIDIFQCLLDAIIRSRHDFSRSSSASICMGRCLAFLWECVEDKHCKEKGEINHALKFARSHAHMDLEKDDEDIESFEETPIETLRRFCAELALDPREAFDSLMNLREVVNVHTRKLSKAEKKQERLEFREVFQHIFFGTRIHERLYLIGKEFWIDSWLGQTKIMALRRVLEGGFQSCLQVYPACV